jgi:hypothetical protein
MNELFDNPADLTDAEHFNSKRTSEVIRHASKAAQAESHPCPDR